MKALVLEQPGKPNSLREADVPQPEPGKGRSARQSVCGSV